MRFCLVFLFCLRKIPITFPQGALLLWTIDAIGRFLFIHSWQALHSHRHHAIHHHWNFNFKRLNHLFSPCSKRCRRPRLLIAVISLHTHTDTRVHSHRGGLYEGTEHNRQAKISHFRLPALCTE